MMREPDAASRLEAPRRRQERAKRECGEQAQQPDSGDRNAPAEQIREDAADHAPRHAADGRPADIEAHRETEPFGMHFFGEISHRNGRHAAERETFERAHDEQRMPVRQRGGDDRQHRRREQRHRHQPMAAPAFRDEARDENGDSKRGRAHRHRQRADCRTDAERLRELGKQRLHAIQQRKGRITGEQQRKRSAPVSARAAFEIRRGIGGTVCATFGIRALRRR